MTKQKSGLGRGLSALISEDTLSEMDQGYIPALPINTIKPNPYQPRIEIDPKYLVELADSIREHGIIEPLIVTRKSENEFELIAGERRLRAAKLAEIQSVPVVIKEASPQQMLELAIVENVQRADLNPLEEALAFDQLGALYNLNHDQIAQKMGISRPAVANKIRLLNLPEEVKRGLLEQKISEGHARALLGLSSKDTMLATYKIIQRDKLSVRATEELIRRLNRGHKKPGNSRSRIEDQRTQQLEKQLKQVFDRVSLTRSQKGGRIVIKFTSEEELDKLIEQLT